MHILFEQCLHSAITAVAAIAADAAAAADELLSKQIWFVNSILIAKAVNSFEEIARNLLSNLDWPSIYLQFRTFRCIHRNSMFSIRFD